MLAECEKEIVSRFSRGLGSPISYLCLALERFSCISDKESVACGVGVYALISYRSTSVRNVS